MRTVIVCRSGPGSRERATREPCILSRLCAAAAHSISKRGGLTLPRNSAGYQPLRRRAGGIDDRIWNRAGILSKHQFLSALKFSPTIRGVGSLIPGLRRALQLLQKPAHRLADRLHFSLPAAKRGLAGLLYGQQQIRRKLKCPTKALKGRTR